MKRRRLLREVSRTGNNPYNSITGKRKPFLSAEAYWTRQVRGDQDARISREALASQRDSSRKRLEQIRRTKGSKSRNTNAETNFLLKREGLSAPRRGSTGASEVKNTLRREAERKRKQRRARGDIWPDGWPRIGK